MSHVILVAFEMDYRIEQSDEAQDLLMGLLPHHGEAIDSWWIAEDQRQDGSDNEAAVFVPLGMSQREARRILVERRRYRGRHSS